MNSLRVWVLVLSIVAASVGFAAGMLVYARWQTPHEPDGPFADYERLVVERFDLSPERARLFRTVLASYNREIEQVKDRSIAASMSAMEPELSRLGARYRDLIRNRVLPESERAEFDRLVQGLPTAPPASPR